MSFPGRRCRKFVFECCRVIWDIILAFIWRLGVTFGVIDGNFLDLKGTRVDTDERSFHQGRIEKQKRTRELAQMRTPPMGANITPTMKKRGRTLLGVRIGLRRSARRSRGSTDTLQTHCHAFSRCWRNAVSGRSQSWEGGDIVENVLAGRRDLGFLSVSSSLARSWSSMDSVRVTSAWDMASNCQDNRGKYSLG